MTEHERNSQAVYNELIKLGFKKEFAYVISMEMQTDFLSKRMVGYLRAARPTSEVEVADEMLIIREERDKFQERIRNRHNIW